MLRLGPGSGASKSMRFGHKSSKHRLGWIWNRHSHTSRSAAPLRCRKKRKTRSVEEHTV